MYGFSFAKAIMHLQALGVFRDVPLKVIHDDKIKIMGKDCQWTKRTTCCITMVKCRG